MLTGVSADFIEESGVGEVAIKASSLPPIERKKREVVDGSGVVRTQSKRTVLQEYVPSGGNYMTDWWHDVEVDPRQGGIYVCCSYGQIVDGELKTLPSEVKKKYLAIKAIRPTFTLYGIRPAHMGRIEKYKHRWMKFDDYADLVLKTEFPLIVDKINLARQWENVENKDRYEKFMTEVFEEYSVFGHFIRKLAEVKALADDVKVKAVLQLNDNVKTPMPLEGEACELAEMERKLDESYPMFDYVEWYRCRRSEFVGHFSEYIRGIDDRTYRAKIQPIKEAV